MQNGYYLSVYTHIDPLCFAYQIPVRHDQNMALWHLEGDSVKLIRYWEFERYTGEKHHALSFFNKQQAVHFINTLLAEVNLSVSQLIAIWGTPELALTDSHTTAWLPTLGNLNSHTLAHVFSGMFVDTELLKNKTIISLAMDGGPDTVLDTIDNHSSLYAGALLQNGKLAIFPISSPGGLWSFISHKLSMKEGSLMALGSACQCSFLNTKINFTPIYTLADYQANLIQLEALCAEAKTICESNTNIIHSGLDNRFSLHENQISAVVKIIQQVSTKWTLATIENIITNYRIDTKNSILSINGGFALNCPTNTAAMESYNFAAFSAPPCVNDSGIALGYGLMAFYKTVPNFNFSLEHAGHGYSNTLLNQTAERIDLFVSDIEQGPVVWVERGAEIGPRALGRRSLLIDPRSESQKTQTNIIKQRQWWRPVAPVILAPELPQWFNQGWSSPYMLHAYDVKPDKKHIIPAVLHLDNTARIQTLTPNEAPLLAKALDYFFKATGVPMLGNTSLNNKGQPILNTYHQAIEFAKQHNIAICYLDGYRLKIGEATEDAIPPGVTDSLGSKLQSQKVDVKAVKQKLNPFNLSRNELKFYWYNPKLRKLDLQKQQDVRKLQRAYKLASKNGLPETEIRTD